MKKCAMKKGEDEKMRDEKMNNEKIIMQNKVDEKMRTKKCQTKNAQRKSVMESLNPCHSVGKSKPKLAYYTTESSHLSYKSLASITQYYHQFCITHQPLHILISANNTLSDEVQGSGIQCLLNQQTL